VKKVNLKFNFQSDIPIPTKQAYQNIAKVQLVGADLVVAAIFQRRDKYIESDEGI
jgi:hypothetical protein